MPERVADWWPALKQVLVYLLVMAEAMLGGAVSYLQRVNMYRVRFSWWMFGIELLTSGFVGLLTYWLCLAASMSAPLTAVMVGISGHMGTRAIFRIERLYNRLLGGRSDGVD